MKEEHKKIIDEFYNLVLLRRHYGIRDAEIFRKELFQQIGMPKLKCLRCGHQWIPRQSEIFRCANPKCNSAKWDVPREKKRK